MLSHVEVAVRALEQLGVPLCVDAVQHGGVGTLAVQPQLAVLAQDHRHALAHVVEVEDVEELVRRLLSELGDGDRVRRARLNVKTSKCDIIFP